MKLFRKHAYWSAVVILTLLLSGWPARAEDRPVEEQSPPAQTQPAEPPQAKEQPQEPDTQTPAPETDEMADPRTQESPPLDAPEAEKEEATDVEQAALKTLEQCDEAYWRGQYPAAIEGYEALLDDATQQLAAAVGLARTQCMVGKYDEAIETLTRVEAQAKESADWHIAMAEAFSAVGLYEDALETIESARRVEPLSAKALYLQGQLHETLGRTKDAVRTYEQMEDIVQDDASLKQPVQMVYLGKILDRYAILTGRKASDQAKNILFNYIRPAYEKLDSNYWPAHIAAGEFLLSKHKDKLAAAEFQQALKINPNLPDAHAGMAALALEHWQFEHCLQAAANALKTNPHHATSLNLQAACYMQWRKPEEAPKYLEKVLAVNPNDLEALSLMAAAKTLLDRPEEASEYAQRVESIQPESPLPAMQIGEWLSSVRQFDEARDYLKQAHDRAPHLPEPLAALGKLYMQTGDEKLAHRYLDKAHNLDDYREDIRNYLNIVMRLETFAVRETEHFIIKVDPEHDEVLLDLVAEYMESVYGEVCGDYGYEPKRKTIIEILPFQKEFSARISGRGWIPTVGASTGRVIAIAAPSRERGQMGLHNWSQVLRHEFAHTVTLEMTGNRIPHWFTESCAVWQQQDKRAFRYIRILVRAVREDDLFPVKELQWGFIRPKKPTDRPLAYAQSEWIMEYIIQTHGFETIREMLQGFGEGMDQTEVFEQIVGVDEEEFDRRFARWARETVIEWGFQPDPPAEPDKAKVRAEANPTDADAQAEYALSLLVKGQMDPAAEAAAKALAIQGDHPRALTVLANVQARKKQFDQAIRTARQLRRVDPDNAASAKILAQCYLHEKDFASAIGALEELQRLQPLDSFSYEQLATLYVQLGQPDKALPNLIYLHKHTMNDQKWARQIADIYRSRREYEPALHYYREVTYINPYETSAYEGMASIYLRQGQYDRALAAAEDMTQLEPDEAKSWNYLAMVAYRAGRAQEDLRLLRSAREAAERAEEIHPDGRATQILQHIDAAIDALENAPQ